MKKQRKKARKYKRKKSFFDIPVWMCIVFILFGCVLGGVFGYDCMYLNQMIEREDAITASGAFDSYELLYSPKSGAVSEVRISFIDRENLYIRHAYHVEMDERLNALERGEQLNMLLHPNSDDIWELTTEDVVILSFEDAKSRTQFENGFIMFVLVGFCGVCVFMGVIALLLKYFDYKKEKTIA